MLLAGLYFGVGVEDPDTALSFNTTDAEALPSVAYSVGVVALSRRFSIGAALACSARFAARAAPSCTAAPAHAP